MSRKRAIQLCTIPVLATAMMGGASAQAGVLPVDVPGVALVWTEPINGYDWIVSYGNSTVVGPRQLADRPLTGPISGNHLTVQVAPDGKTITFDEPLTLMVPGSPELADLAVPYAMTQDNCDYGFGHASCTSRYGTFCSIFVNGGPGPDNIVVRHTPRDFYCDTHVSAGNSTDVIDVRDGAWSHVRCGPSDDTVLAEPGDDIAADCESVTGL
jgi:hypothetical protein